LIIESEYSPYKVVSRTLLPQKHFKAVGKKIKQFSRYQSSQLGALFDDREILVSWWPLVRWQDEGRWPLA
jgi:hypothetical protein